MSEENKKKKLIFLDNGANRIPNWLKEAEKRTSMSKDLERLNNKNLPCSNCKGLKALEIIKEKPQTLYLVQTCENYDNYFNKVDITLMEYVYSPEEYDLLKEVLL